MSFTNEEIREDYLSKTRKVNAGNKGVLTQDMCRATAEKRSIRKYPVVFMQRRIKRTFTCPSGKKKSVVFINRPRVIGTFKEREI
jgi:hypothetical protein